MLTKSVLQHAKADRCMDNNDIGRVQSSDVKDDKSRGPLWAEYREGLFLQIKVERPELIVNKTLLFTRVNQ